MTASNPDITMTRQELVEMYARYPKMLAWELRHLFQRIEKPEDTTVHNLILGRLQAACPSRELLLHNVTRAFIETAQSIMTTTQMQGVSGNGED